MTEDKLRKHIEEGHPKGKNAFPFKVPEGYFDTLCDRVMAQLPQQPAQTPHRRLFARVWKYAAVVAVGMFVGGALLFTHKSSEVPEPDVKMTKVELAQDPEPVYYDEEYISAALDYAMVDNNEIALYLTEY